MDEYEDYCLKLRNHVVFTEKDPQAKNLSLAAIDSFEKTMRTKYLSEEHRSKILDAAKSQNSGPYYIGTNLILMLIPTFPEIETTIRELARSNSSYERWVAISIVRDERINEKLANELIQDGLKDKSAKIRSFAVEGVYIRSLSRLIPKLKERAGTEKNKMVAQSIDWVLSRME